MNRFTGGRIALGALYAVLGALATPLMLSLGATFLWPPMLIALLYAWSGALPAVLCAALTLISPALFIAVVALFSGLPVPTGEVLVQAAAYVAGDATWMTIAALVLVLPGLATILLLRQRMPFYRAMACSIGAQLLLIAAAVLMLFARSGPDLVGGFVGWFRDTVDGMEFGTAPGVMMNTMLVSLGNYGLFGQDTGIDFAKGMLTVAEQAQLTRYMIDLFDRSLRLNLVSMMLVSGVTTGMLSYTMAARVCARRGDDPIVPYRHIHEWRLPRDMVIALPLITIGCAIANSAQVQGMDAAYVALLNLCYLAFSVQGAGALARRLRQSGMAWGRRTGMIVLMLIILPRILTIIGLWSALLGSRGVLTELIQRRNQKKGD